MIEKYNAFISYKHAPLDNKIAAAIQRDLERYVIPRRIRRETGMKKIERIFRDQAELPITSDLDDNIGYALEHSDYLIVICSESTRLSTWVPREIEYFLPRASPPRSSRRYCADARTSCSSRCPATIVCRAGRPNGGNSRVWLRRSSAAPTMSSSCAPDSTGCAVWRSSGAPQRC